MRKLFAVLLLAAATGMAPEARAQRAPNRVIPDRSGPIFVRLVRGDLVQVDADTVIAYNRQADAVHRQIKRTADSAIGALRARTALGDSITMAAEAVIAEFRRIVAVQNLAYDSLRRSFTTVDTLARAATRNTDQALAYARRLRATSFLSSGLVGGVAGGFGFHGSGGGFRWSGFGLGAAGGLLLNLGLQRIFH